MRDTVNYNGFTNYATWLMTLHIGYNSEWLKGVYETAAQSHDYAELEKWLRDDMQSQVYDYLYPQGQHLEDEKTPEDMFIEELCRATLDDVDYTNLAHHYFDAISDEERSANGNQ